MAATLLPLVAVALEAYVSIPHPSILVGNNCIVDCVCVLHKHQATLCLASLAVNLYKLFGWDYHTVKGG